MSVETICGIAYGYFISDEDYRKAKINLTTEEELEFVDDLEPYLIHLNAWCDGHGYILGYTVLNCYKSMCKDLSTLPPFNEIMVDIAKVYMKHFFLKGIKLDNPKQYIYCSIT